MITICSLHTNNDHPLSLSPSLEMMSVVYNYIRVDNDTFLSNPKHVEIVISMAKTVSTYYNTIDIYITILY